MSCCDWVLDFISSLRVGHLDYPNEQETSLEAAVISSISLREGLVPRICAQECKYNLKGQRLGKAEARIRTGKATFPPSDDLVLSHLWCSWCWMQSEVAPVAGPVQPLLWHWGYGNTSWTETAIYSWCFMFQLGKEPGEAHWGRCWVGRKTSIAEPWGLGWCTLSRVSVQSQSILA